MTHHAHSVVVSLLCLSLASPALGAVETSRDAERASAIRLAREGRCEAALEALAAVQSTPASDAEVARYQGECSIRLRDFRRAIESLEMARELDPALPDVDLHLAIAYYHAGRLDEAESTLERAGATQGGRPEFMLYSGLVAFARTDYGAAIDRLNAARRLEGAPVEPMASFFLGRAAQGVADGAKARTAFERVLSEHPDTPWAAEAERALDELEDDDTPAWWASLELGFEHDDNPLLRGRGVGLPSEIAGQSDQRGYWFFDLGATLFDRAGLRGGATLRYGGSEHAELERFDTHAPGATVWLDRDLGVADSSLRLQYDFDTAWIDAHTIRSAPFVISHLLGTSLYKPWSGGAYSLVSGTVGWDDYRYHRPDFEPNALGSTPASPRPLCLNTALDFCAPIRNERDATDRDGIGVSASLLHHAALPFELPGLTNPWVEGEYRYQRYWSEGSEYDHQRHQVQLGIGVVLPFEIGLRASGRYAYAPYGNPSVFPDPSDVAAARALANAPSPPGPGGPVEYFLDTRARREHESGVRVSLERAIGEQIVVTARYSRTRTRSTADVFSFTRDLFGISIRVGLGG